ncbi:MAG: GxxExxY protein [Planctomycetes bacterium]|nr:GxxExxY protein [Planctomycetota bacterium]
MKINELTREVIGAAIEVHRTIGPGLLDSAYEACLCRELSLRRIHFVRQRPLPLEYKGLKLGGWKASLLINFHVPVLKDGIRRLVLGLQE